MSVGGARRRAGGANPVGVSNREVNSRFIGTGSQRIRAMLPPFKKLLGTTAASIMKPKSSDVKFSWWDGPALVKMEAGVHSVCPTSGNNGADGEDGRSRLGSRPRRPSHRPG